MRTGRPTDYSLELAAHICSELSQGRPLTKICAADDMPAMSSVYLWLLKNRDFSEMYARAREDQADTMADEIVQIADDGLNDTYIDEDGKKRVDQDVVARSRLRVDARKWVAAKLKPRKYGDRITQDINATVTSKIEMSEDALLQIAAGASKVTDSDA